MVQRAQKLDNCQWSRVLFTDESRFSTRSDSQRVLIWREIGTRFYTSNIKERHHYGGPGVLIWGCIMLNWRTELYIFGRGFVTGDRYCEEVLLPHVCLFRGAIGPDFIFMDDNARPHRTLAVEELLESEDITRMNWPAYSPDLNPIEHVWDALGRCIAARLHHPEDTQQLKPMLIEEWALLPQEMLHQLVLKIRSTGWRSWFVAGLLRLRLRVRHRPKSVDFQDVAKNRHSETMSYDYMTCKRSLDCSCLAWLLSAKLNPRQVRIVRAQVFPSREETGR
ncbi:transposable element Tc3 transposase [Trichonephila clavipes]|nr:transposable element Tc3 transposase [Trichonephila clavipes]